MTDEWPQIVALVRSYCARRYARAPSALTLHFPDGEPHREPLPAAPPCQPPPAPSPAREAWASGDAPKQRGDFASVYWPGLGTFALTPKQRAVVKALWGAEGGVPQAVLLRAAGSDCTRLHDLFSRSPAWGTLVLPGDVPGSYRLPPRDDPD